MSTLKVTRVYLDRAEIHEVLDWKQIGFATAIEQFWSL